MREEGLCDSLRIHQKKIFLSERSLIPAEAIVSTIEGLANLVEVQALVTPTSYGMPQRTVTGFDLRRLQMLLAVIENALAFDEGGHDKFLVNACRRN